MSSPKTRHYSSEELYKTLPHKHENVLIDHLISYAPEEIRGELELTITQKDRLNRQFFFKNKSQSETVCLSTVLMEILALGCIITSNKLTTTNLALFAGISNFKKYTDFKLNETIRGNITGKRFKKGFMTADGNLVSTDNIKIAEGELKAFFIEKDNDKESTPKLTTPLEENCHFILPKSDTLKNPSMYFIDTLNHLNSESQQAQGTYNFPKEHPLIKGHFPDSPLLMGVLQWLAVEDLAHVIALKLHHDQQMEGKFILTGDAEIFNKDHVITTEIKGFTAISYINHPEYNNQGDLIATNKVIFRQKVSPGDHLVIKVTNLNIQQ